VIAPRQAFVSKGGIGSYELGIAIGRQIDTGETLVVQRERERQRDGCNRIIAVITNVGGARHDRTSALGDAD
jgi:hypothetical protein